MSRSPALNARVTSCPGCGAKLKFTTGSARVVVCGYCNYAVARTDVGVESLGKVADLVPTGARLCIGATGTWKGEGFRIVGREQLAWSDGVWDEWYVVFDGGKDGWLSEDDGRYAIFRMQKTGTAPRLPQLQVGRGALLGSAGRFVVTEIREATYQGAAGTLPESFHAGETFRYADLSGRNGALATLDFSEGEVPLVYVGERVSLDDLSIRLPEGVGEDGEGLAAADASIVNVSAEAMTCPVCNAPLDIRCPRHAEQIVCDHCNSLVSIKSGRLARLQALQKGESAPPLLHKECTFDGRRYLAIGWLARTGTDSDGVDFFWDEYLLYDVESDGDYRFLCVDDKGHWSFSTPIDAGDVDTCGPVSDARYNGRMYRIFARDRATVGALRGEFFWKVKVGDTAVCTDYIAPPEGVSCEEEDDGREVTWSLERHLDPAQVQEAFGLDEALPEPRGIGDLTCSRYHDFAKASLVPAIVFSIIAVAIFMALSFAASGLELVDMHTPSSNWKAENEQLRRATPSGRGGGSFSDMPSAELPDPLSESAVSLSPQFKISKTGQNLMLDVRSDVNQDWAAVSALLINETTGEMFDLGEAEVSYYHGYEGGESWSEGSQDQQNYRSAVPAGDYVLRVDSYWEKGRDPPDIHVRLVQGSPRMSMLFVVILLLWLFPGCALALDRFYENQRWADSDFGPDDDDDD